MPLIRMLRESPDFSGSCPKCCEIFQLDQAQLFSLSEMFPEPALARIQELKSALKDRRQKLKSARQRMTTRAAVTAQSVLIGKICEKIIPSLSGFPFPARDCRSLLEPIDFLVFNGLGQGEVRSVSFLEIKTGGARLNAMQRLIANAVNDGRVEFEILHETGR